MRSRMWADSAINIIFMNSGSPDALRFNSQERKIAPKRVALVLEQLSKLVEPQQFFLMATQGEAFGNWEHIVAEAIENGKLEELEVSMAAELQLFVDLLRDGKRSIDVLDRDGRFVFVYNSAIAIANYRSQQEVEKGDSDRGIPGST